MARLSDQEKENLGRLRWLCMDCGKDTFQSEEYFMLWYKVWRSINYKIEGMLCLNCVEMRLGRQLASSDFNRATINSEQAKLCPALAARLKK
jgi:hypothetical protein